MSKALFLDIDGVLNSNFENDIHQREISNGTLIDEEKIKLLAHLVNKTNSKIILHSGWRMWFDSELKPLRIEAKKLIESLEKEGLHIDGITPDLTTEEIRKTKKFSLVKADEILLWLKSHNDVTEWVVLDDLDLHNTQIEQHQVKPDPTIGLTLEDVENAVKFLEEKMNIVLYSDKIDEYLKHDDVIDYENEAIAQLADTLFQKASNEQEFIKLTYEFVRDKISHSADINEDTITCTASEVLKAGHGICFAKSHLLAALLRCKSVPTGFCYQKLILDDETAPVLIYHGLNGVYIKDCQKWIRLDARGNKPGVNAQFSVETEQLAFPVRPEMGEEDNFIIYPDPDIKVLEKLRKSKTRTELWDNLPIELEYDTDLKHNTDLEHNYV